METFVCVLHSALSVKLSLLCARLNADYTVPRGYQKFTLSQEMTKFKLFSLRTNDVNKDRKKSDKVFSSCVYVSDEFRFYRLFHLRFAIKSHSDSHRFVLTRQLKMKCKRQIRIRINSRFFFSFQKADMHFAQHRAHLLAWLIRALVVTSSLIVTGACSMSFTVFFSFRHIHFAQRNLCT